MRKIATLLATIAFFVSFSQAQTTGVTVGTTSYGLDQVALGNEDMNERVTAARLAQALGYTPEDSIEIVVLILPNGRVTGSYKERYSYLTDHYQPLVVENPFGRNSDGSYYHKDDNGDYVLQKVKDPVWDGEGRYFWRSIKKSDL